MLIARFIRFYGIAAYRDARWPTRDGVIPAQLFWVLVQEMPGTWAAEQLRAYYASFLALGQVQGNREARPALERALRSLTDLAYPNR